MHYFSSRIIPRRLKTASKPKSDLQICVMRLVSVSV